VLIAKNTEKVLVYALDINPMLNRISEKEHSAKPQCKNCVIPILGEREENRWGQAFGVADA